MFTHTYTHTCLIILSGNSIIVNEILLVIKNGIINMALNSFPRSVIFILLSWLLKFMLEPYYTEILKSETACSHYNNFSCGRKQFCGFEISLLLQSLMTSH